MTRTLALVAVIGVALLVVWAAASSDSAQRAGGLDSSETAVPGAGVEPPMLGEEPPILASAVAPLVELDGWLQADFDELADLEGQVVIVQFWTFGCINCRRTLANLADIYSSYHDAGLEIVGVHAPEFDYEKDVDSIANAAAELGVIWPIALDTDEINFRSWQGTRRFWPRTYVIDQDGRLRFDHIGEGNYEELRATVTYLLAQGA